MFKCHITKYMTYNRLPTWRKKKSGDCVILCGKIKQWWCRKIFELLFTWQFNTSFMWQEFTPPLKAQNRVFENITGWTLESVTPLNSAVFTREIWMTSDTSFGPLVRRKKSRIHTSFVTCLRTVHHNHVLTNHVALTILSSELWCMCWLLN